jgi:NAD+ kinase
MPDRRNIYFYHNYQQGLLEKIGEHKKVAEQHDLIIVEDPKKANIIVSVGGDGAFLQAVRKTGFRDDCLYVGISTEGTQSLYCDFDIHNPEKIMDALQNGQVEVRRYPTIEVTVDQSTSFICLNDFSIRSSIIKTFVVDVFIDDLPFETFRGDGMIVSTPTGSTGYNKSVSGAVVDPMIPCMQVNELASLNNNNYRTLGSPFILSGERKLTLKVAQTGNEYPAMAMDNEALGIRHVENIEIKLSDKSVKTLKLKDNSFWEKVKRTFL